MQLSTQNPSELFDFCQTTTVITENVNKMQVRSLQEEYAQADLISHCCSLLTNTPLAH